MQKYTFENFATDKIRLDGFIQECLDAAEKIIGHQVDITEANVIYYTGRFKSEQTKHDLKACIDSAETYYQEINRLKKKLKI